MAHVAARVAAAAVGGIVLNNTLNFYTNPRRRLLGEDARMRDADFWCNYLVGRVHFVSPPPNLEQRVRNWVRAELDDPASFMRARQRGKRRYDYDERDTDTLMDIHCRRVEPERLMDDAALETMAWENECAIMVAHSTHGLAMIVNHQFADGMRAMRMAGKLWDGNVGQAYVPKFRYIPLVTEVAMIRSGVPRPGHRHLRYVSWTTPNTRGKTTYLKRPLEDVKTARRRCGVSFNSVIASATVRAVFEKIPACTRLSVGIVAAFENKRRFNNFGLVGITVRRPVTDDPDEVTRAIDRAVRRHKHHAMMTYVLANVYNIEAFDIGDFDILVSGFPVAMRHDGTMGDISIGGVPLDTFYFSQAHSSVPIYVGHLSTASTIHVSTTLRCPDLPDDFLSSTTL